MAKVKKIRTPLPKDTSSEILYLSERTCCVCTTRGKPIQIHHIDETPSNNVIENLAVLCLDCHNETMLRGGFGRHLTADVVRRHRAGWLERVKARRDEDDKMASIENITGIVAPQYDFEHDAPIYNSIDINLLNDYLNKMLVVHQKRLINAQSKWGNGVTSVMNQGNYDMIGFYEEVLVQLANFYRPNHFNQNPKHYFNEIISSRFLWHRLILEPGGSGTGGSMISTITGGSVMEDVKRMIVNMVDALSMEGGGDSRAWKKKWLSQ
ncbi:MAG: hypothetical protein RLZZ628_3823 [Bacteroidota bacterium]|jgi:hypothetical protein